MTRRAPNRGPLPDISEIEDPTDTLSASWGKSTISYLKRLSLAMSKDLESRVSKQQPVSKLYLLSPSGYTFSISVSDTGTLTTTLEKQ